MDVLKRGVGFSIGLVCILGKVEGDVQKGYYLLVGFDCDSQSVIFENAANAFFNVFCNCW